MEEMQQEVKKDTIQISKSALLQIISGVLGILLVISIFTSGFGFGKDDSQAGPTGGTVVNQPTGNNNVPTGIVDVSADDDPVIGDKDAKVTIIEFSDFQCPFCSRFREQTFDQLKKEYIDTGKVKFVYRDFPLESIHPNALKAAEASECADDQGKFWEYHDILFSKQDEWSQSDGISKFKVYAKDLSLDTSKFDKCL